MCDKIIVYEKLQDALIIFKLLVVKKIWGKVSTFPQRTVEKNFWIFWLYQFQNLIANIILTSSSLWVETICWIKSRIQNLFPRILANTRVQHKILHTFLI